MRSGNEAIFHFTIGHIRYVNILTWLRSFRVKIVLFCHSTPKRDSDTKKTTLNIDVYPEGHGAM